MIIAADAAFFDETIGQVGPPVRAFLLHQAKGAAQILVENQILAHQPDRLDAVGLAEFGRSGDRHPVAPQQAAHRGARTNLGEQDIFGEIHATNSTFKAATV